LVNARENVRTPTIFITPAATKPAFIVLVFNGVPLSYLVGLASGQCWPLPQASG
jgi:hypothetical protein